MTTHTPGPWRWVRDGNTWMLVAAHSGQPTVLAITDDKLADLRGDVAEWESRPTSFTVLVQLAARLDGPARLVPLTPDHPDARLIEAAPDLLAMLEDVVLLIDCLGVDRKTRKAVEALLARVKGEGQTP